MRLAVLLCGAALSVTSAWALAQDAPESLLPPGFDNPAPAPAPSPSPSRTPATKAPPRPTGDDAAPRAVSTPVVQEVPGSTSASSGSPSPARAPATVDEEALARLPSLDELARMSPEEIVAALNVTPTSDIPPAARRSLRRIGIIDEDEGGFGVGSVSAQSPQMVRALLVKNRGRMVSRWGHILLRRALASRMDAPRGMNPADFVAMRAALLLRMGEADAARALVQDVDTAAYTGPLIDAAFDAYVAMGDFTGLCPMQSIHPNARSDPKWETSAQICSAFRGNGTQALRQIDRAISRGTMPAIDLRLAQKYAGAAGTSRRAVTIEWDDVKDMNPWRYGLATAVGVEVPEGLSNGYAAQTALSPAAGLAARAAAADAAAAQGVLSSSAMVDIYGQIYIDPDMTGPWAERGETLRNAYVLSNPAGRVSALQKLWEAPEGGDPGADESGARYGRLVLTAFAAARLPVGEAGLTAASDLVAAMLSAGLDRNAAMWSDSVEDGSLAWALLAVGRPGNVDADTGDLDTFVDDDTSADSRKSAFLVAGLAGLGRISDGTRDSYASRLELDLTRESSWSRVLNSAVQSGNTGMVALLTGLGMQGTDWDRMTARQLYRVVSALRAVGLEGEARMIAAEAVTRA